MRIGFCVSGRGHLARAALARSGTLGLDPVIVLGEAAADDEVAVAAEQAGAAWIRAEGTDRAAFDRCVTDALLGAELDLLCLTFDKLIPPAVVARYPSRIINVHMSLLPAFAGLHGLRRTVDSGARFGGATIHEVGDGTDDGPIVAQCVAALRRDEGESEFGGRLYPLLEAMFLQVIAWYATGRVTRNERGQVLIRDGVYGQLPVSPALEPPFTRVPSARPGPGA
jgi:phosphoribosylglycinamide formyltransferase-1